MTKMTLNSTYKLINKERFMNIPGASITNTQIVKQIESSGGTIRPIEATRSGSICKFILATGEVVDADKNNFYISPREFSCFEKVAEGYPGKKDNDWIPLTITVHDREDAEKTIKVLQKLLA